MTPEQIIAIQKIIGTIPDGFWGQKSIRAAQRHLIGLMPETHPFPVATPSARLRFFGEPGDEGRLRQISVAELGVKYEGRPVATIRCHEKIAGPLSAALKELAGSEWAWVLGRYDGCYANRPMRGTANTPSMHARGAAIDFCAGENGNHTPWPVAATMPFGVMEIFARHGFMAAGAFWGRDAMHFEATRPQPVG